MNDLLVFVVEGYNRYSIAALAGIVDQELPELPVAFLQARNDLATLAGQVRQLARRWRRVILAFSFMTPQLPRISPMLAGLEPRPDVEAMQMLPVTSP